MFSVHLFLDSVLCPKLPLPSSAWSRRRDDLVFFVPNVTAAATAREAADLCAAAGGELPSPATTDKLVFMEQLLRRVKGECQ